MEGYLKTFNKFEVERLNETDKGKYLICESREGFGSRMFIRTVTNTLIDGFRKNGWWDAFTISTREVSIGLWLCSVVEYRLDKNGYINLKVDPIVPVPELKFHLMFEDINGSWNSPAVELMVSRGFIHQYQFYSFRELNIEELKKRYPKYANFDSYLGIEVLKDWLKEEITLKEIEDALNTKTNYERLLDNLFRALSRNSVKGFTEYPLTMSKLKINCETKRDIDDYIHRNLISYEDLVRSRAIEALDSDNIMDKIEYLLKYRVAVKKQEKEAKKKNRNK